MVAENSLDLKLDLSSSTYSHLFKPPALFLMNQLKTNKDKESSGVKPISFLISSFSAAASARCSRTIESVKSHCPDLLSSIRGMNKRNKY